MMSYPIYLDMTKAVGDRDFSCIRCISDFNINSFVGKADDMVLLSYQQFFLCGKSYAW